MIRDTFYERWMSAEGLPVVKGYGLADVREIDRLDWSRTGGKGAFIHLAGMEGFTGMHVGEIPSQKALDPQRHLYQQFITILSGRGSAEVWLPGETAKTTFEWQQDSLFSIPLNCSYRLYNTGTEPVVYLAVNDAPTVMDIFHNEAFIFDNDYKFTDRFQPSDDFYSTSNRYENYAGGISETNFVENINSVTLDPLAVKGNGVDRTAFEMAGSTMVAHVNTWPVGRYHKAHHHLGGAILYGLRSEGYVLIWPQEAGVRPYEQGNGDAVVKVDWGVGSVYSPPTKWFHQHFNTGDEPARQLAFRGGSVNHPTGIRRAGNRIIEGKPGVHVSVREGGSLVSYEEEDPRILEDYREALSRNGLVPDMDPSIYAR